MSVTNIGVIGAKCKCQYFHLYWSVIHEYFSDIVWLAENIIKIHLFSKTCLELFHIRLNSIIEKLPSA